MLNIERLLMNKLEIVGIVAACISLTSLCFKTTTIKGTIYMRLLNLVGCAIFVVYGFILPAYSTGISNIFCVVINFIYLIKAIREEKQMFKHHSRARIHKRCKKVAKYILKTGCTIREAASEFEYSKSQCFVDMTVTLPSIHRNLALKVNEVLERNKKERAIRGGMATCYKYAVQRGEIGTIQEGS